MTDRDFALGSASRRHLVAAGRVVPPSMPTLCSACRAGAKI
ncbi:MAG: hypothetical protein ACREFL_06410 [Stellaceae bacterium]